VKPLIDKLIDIELNPELTKTSFQQLLNDNSHILCRSRYYEDAVDSIKLECNDKLRLETLETIDSNIRDFIVTERKVRARNKINYLIVAASLEKLDYAISNLYER
jgi:hypothetical protein